ncbi:cytochrome P450 [Myceligenerans salitolerans]|uniref:Cytochrome P450 n=1 Tax=Myceligenerans salitolerans TaxID=1230528 RepID=A0ABS3I4X8_9MICO|nr:cytochrome P450 [Myceligenerans salitolerans]
MVARPSEVRPAEARWEERVQRAAHPVAYPAVRALRHRPVVRIPRVGLVVNDATLAREVLLDVDRYSKVGPGAPSDLWTPILGPSVLLNMEGAEHAAMRRALGPIFSPRAVRELVRAPGQEQDSRESGATGPLAGMVARLGAGETVDLARVVADQAGAVICGLVGLPPTDTAVRESMAAARAVTGMVRLHRRRLTTTQVAYARRVLGELTASARDAYRRGDESTVPGRMRGLGLSEREAMGAVGAFVLTGTETIQSFVPRLLAIAHDTGWMDRLLGSAGDGDLRRRVVEEALRVTVPTPAMLRSVRTAAVLGGEPVRDGDRIVIATVNCCRAAGGFDPERPVDPDVRHLWFGAGPHFCLGMPLAMAQVEAVLDALASLAAHGRQLVVGRRRPARGVLVPAYQELVLAAPTPDRSRRAGT